MTKEILIFTDGSSRGNPGPGGWGAIVATPSDIIELGGREERTTNNRMELKAAIGALSALRGMRENSGAILFSDSSYVVNGITKWVSGWKQNGWKTKEKGEVLNRDLWQELDELNLSLKVSWRYVAGHAGHGANERCDRIATAFADGGEVTLYRGGRAGYRMPIDKPSAGQKSVRGGARTGKAYSYVSLVDGEVRRHQTWEECERRVKGKKGVRYRKVFSAEEESALVAEFSK